MAQIVLWQKGNFVRATRTHFSTPSAGSLALKGQARVPHTALLEEGIHAAGLGFRVESCRHVLWTGQNMIEAATAGSELLRLRTKYGIETGIVARYSCDVLALFRDDVRANGLGPDVWCSRGILQNACKLLISASHARLVLKTLAAGKPRKRNPVSTNDNNPCM